MADTSLDLQGLIRQSATTSALAAKTQANLESIGDQQKSVTDELIAAILGGRDATGETALSLKTKELGELEAQNRKAAFYQSINNGEGYAKLLTRLTEEFNSSMGEASQLSQSIKERQSVGFFDNPLSFLWNQLQLPDEQNALAATVQDANTRKQQIDGLNNFMDHESQVEEKFKQTLSAAAIDSKVSALSSELAAKAASAKLHSFQLNAQNVQAVLSASLQQVELINKVVAARNSAEHMELSRQAAARAGEQFEQWKKDNKDKEDFSTQYMGWINKGAELLGREPLEGAKIKTILASGSTSLKAELDVLAERGWQAMSSGKPALGQTPAAVAEFSQLMRTPLPENLSPIYIQAMQKLEALRKKDPTAYKTKAEFDQKFNQLVREEAAGMVEGVTAENKANPYLIPPASVVSTSEAVKKTQLFKEVLAPVISAANFKSQDHNQIIDLGLQAVKDKKITLQELIQGVYTYYTVGVSLNNREKQFYKYSLPEQSEYSARVRSFATTSLSPFPGAGQENVVLTDLPELSLYITKRYRETNVEYFNTWPTYSEARSIYPTLLTSREKSNGK